MEETVEFENLHKKEAALKADEKTKLEIAFAILAEVIFRNLPNVVFFIAMVSFSLI